METKICKVLAIGSPKWSSRTRSLLERNGYEVETITEFQQAVKRLRHNSYDLLLIEQKFFRFRSFDLGQLSYAMSRPTLIICSNIFVEFGYWLWKLTDRFCRRHPAARRLISVVCDRGDDALVRKLGSMSTTGESLNMITKEICLSFKEQGKAK